MSKEPDLADYMAFLRSKPLWKTSGRSPADLEEEANDLLPDEFKGGITVRSDYECEFSLALRKAGMDWLTKRGHGSKPN